MKKALLLVLMFGLACCIAACSTSNVGVQLTPERVVSGSFAVETEPGVGVFTPALNVVESGGTAVVTVSAQHAVDLAAAYLHIKYDSAKYSPEKVEFGDFLGRDAEVLSLALTDRPDEVPVGLAQVAFNGAVPKDGEGVLAVVTFRNTPFTGDRVSSGAPSGNKNKVDDLAIIDQANNVAELQWTEHNSGDYDNNGLVGITDLTPLAVNFGQTVASASDPEWAALVDGDGNGIISVADLAPIGQNFGDGLSGYLVYIDANSSTLYDTSGLHAPRPSGIDKKKPVVYSFSATYVTGETPQFSVRPVQGSDLAHPGVNSNLAALLVDQPGAPSAPTAVTATAGQSTGVGRVALSWTKSASTDVLKYDIHRKLSSGSSWTLLTQVSGSASSYTDNDPTLTDDDYDYRILARDLSDQTSGWSNTATAHPYYPPPPEAPTNLVATAGQSVGIGTVELTWDFSVSAGLTAYVVERKLNSSSSWGAVGEVASTLDHYTDTDASLTAALYDYRVKARNAMGQLSDASNISSATPYYPPTLDPPLNPVAEPSTSEALAIDVRWSKPANDFGTGFRVYRKGPGDSSFSPLSPDVPFDQNPLKYIDGGLQTGQTYEYYVKTLDGSSESAACMTVSSFPSNESTPIQILDVTTDKTTHHTSGSEDAAQLDVISDPDLADTYAWTGPGVFSDTTAKNPTWKPNASTPKGLVTLTVTATLGPNSDTGTVNLYVTGLSVVTSFQGRDGVTRQIGDPAGSGICPDTTLTATQYLQPLIDGGAISAGTGTFHEFTIGHPVLFDEWELWCGPCKAEFPDLDDYGETYREYGFLFVANSSDPGAGYGINDIKSWFQANAIDYCNEFHGNIYSAMWAKLGADGYIPFNVLIDRDGMVRKIGGQANGADWATGIKELCGAPL